MNNIITIADRIRGKKLGVCLSSGFFGFYHHAGFLAALEEIGVAPAFITGTSAGALTGAMYASGLSAGEIRDLLLRLRRQDFWDIDFPFTDNGFSLLTGDKFRNELRRVLKVPSFEECPIPLTVGVYNLRSGRVEHISSGSLVEAVYASCAYPYLFKPSKMNGCLYWDGGFGEKAALVPFLRDKSLEAVLVSYLPRRETRHCARRGIFQFIPPLSSFFASVPAEERIERDKASIATLRESGLEVLVFAPPRIWLGPFTMQRGVQSFDKAVAGTRAIFNSTSAEALGALELA